MAPVELPPDDYLVLPLKMPALPSFPHAPIHELRLKRHTPKVSSPDDSRSLFLKNVPVDSTEAHFRAVFTSLVGAGRFETITFENDEQKAVSPFGLDPAQTTRIAGLGSKKRKREDAEEQERIRKEEEAAKLPEIWTRRLRHSGSTAVVRLADEKSVAQVLKAVTKLAKTKKIPTWGDGLNPNDHPPPLGAKWITAHLRLARADTAEMQEAVHAFFNSFNRKEKEAAEEAKRLRGEPDEDGFVTVVRGGGSRDAPAHRAQAEEARRRMLEKERKKKEELGGFYRFQVRERRKAEQEGMRRRFEEDRERVKGMKERRGKFKPES